VQRLEQIGACPNSLFPALSSDASPGTLGAEATLLAEYLEDIAKEEDASPRKLPDLQTIVSLAPFIGREELGNMVRERFRFRDRGRRSRERGDESQENQEDREEEERGRPNLKTLVHLAPHMSSADLGELVRAYVSRGDGVDLKYIVHLAPHMNSEDLGQLVRACVSGERGFDAKYLMHLAPHMNSKDLSAIMRECMPAWFGSEPAGAKPEKQAAPPSPEPPNPPPAAPAEEPFTAPVAQPAPAASAAPAAPVASTVYSAPPPAVPAPQPIHVAPLQEHDEAPNSGYTSFETR